MANTPTIAIPRNPRPVTTFTSKSQLAQIDHEQNKAINKAVSRAKSRLRKREVRARQKLNRALGAGPRFSGGSAG